MIYFVTKCVCDKCGKEVEFKSEYESIRCKKKHAEISLKLVYNWTVVKEWCHKKKHYCKECALEVQNNGI